MVASRRARVLSEDRASGTPESEGLLKREIGRKDSLHES